MGLKWQLFFKTHASTCGKGVSPAQHAASAVTFNACILKLDGDAGATSMSRNFDLLLNPISAEMSAA